MITESKLIRFTDNTKDSNKLDPHYSGINAVYNSSHNPLNIFLRCMLSYSGRQHLVFLFNITFSSKKIGEVLNNMLDVWAIIEEFLFQILLLVPHLIEYNRMPSANVNTCRLPRLVYDKLY